jgi:hypothetical protein
MASRRGKQQAFEQPPARKMVREIAVGDDAAWAEALAAWDDRLEDASARTAAQLFEKIARERRRDADAWAWCARANYYLGDYASERQAGRYFELGTELGRKAIELDGGHIGALFWTSCCLGSYAESLGLLRRATAAPELLRSMGRVWERQPTYFHRGIARFVGQAFVRQGGLVTKILSMSMPEIGPKRVLEELRTSIAEGPPLVLTHQTLAQLAWHENRDRETVAAIRAVIERLDLDSEPSLAPENHRDHERALAILTGLH